MADGQGGYVLVTRRIECLGGCMSKQWIRCAALATAFGLAATGCGAEDKPSADPEPSTSSSPATPTETVSASPTAKPQPSSTTGATYDTLNWDEYADDPALLAWKKALEAAAGSMKQGKLLPGLRENTTPEMFRVYYANVETGLEDGWQVKPVAHVWVESSKARGTKTTLRLCLWSPTTSVYLKDGSPVGGGPIKKEWNRQVVRVTETGGRPRVAEVDFSAGICKGLQRP